MAIRIVPRRRRACPVPSTAVLKAPVVCENGREGGREGGRKEGGERREERGGRGEGEEGGDTILRQRERREMKAHFFNISI